MATHSSYFRLWKKAFFVFFLLSASYSLPTASEAATLTMDPATGSYGPGDMFVVTVRLDTTPAECVNAAMVELLYPADWMKATAVSKGESLLTLWTDEPTINIEHGKVSFAGGIPAGYCGRVQGDPGKTNILAKIIFTIPGNMIGGKVATGPVPMALTFSSSTRVLLNDGFGTPVQLSLKEAMLTHSLTSSGIKNEWLDIVHADNTPPDEFKVSVEHDPSTFGGKYFIVFSTVDKQSGVHHYEVREDDPGRLGFQRGKNDPASFAVAQSPYPLVDQELKSRVTVRAIDNANNIQESIIPPASGTFSVSALHEAGSSAPGSKKIWWTISTLFFLFAGGIGSWHYTRQRRRKNGQEPKENETPTT